MTSADAQPTVRVRVVGEVQTHRLCVRTNQPDDPISFPGGNSEYFLLSVALHDPQLDYFACGSPTTLPPPGPANRSLVALDGSLEQLSQFLYMCTTGSDQPKEALDHGSSRQGTVSLPIDRTSKDEQLQLATLRGIVKID
jgi:hypothetical protein